MTTNPDASPESTGSSTPPTVSAQDAKRTARNVGALVITRIVINGVSFVWQLILAALLSTALFGVYQTVIAMMSVWAVVANFGIGAIAIREIASTPDRIRQYAASMLVTQTALALVSYVGVVVTGIGAGYSQVVLAYAAVASLSIVVDIFGSVANDLLLAQERMVITSMIETAHLIVRVGLALLALWLGYGLLGIYAATIVAGVLRGGVLWSIHWRDGVTPAFPLQRDLTWRMLVNAAPLALTAFLFQAYQNTDRLMTTAIIGVESTGLLGLAFMLNFGIIELLNTTLLDAMYPMLSRYYQQGAPETFGFLIEKIARFMVTVSLPLALLLTFFAPELILTFFSEDYAGSIGIVRIYIWFTVLTMVANVFGRALLVQNQQRRTFVVRLAALVLNIALNLLLLVRYRDPRGAAVASVAAEALALLLFALFVRAPGLDWSQLRGGLLRLMGLGVITAGAMALLGSWHPVAGMLGGGAVYIGGLLFGGVLFADDWDFLYRLTAALPGGSLIRRYWQRDTIINW